MRRFKLINAKGNEFDLMRRDAYFSTPDGLGYSMSSEYALIGNVYELIKTSAQQKAPAGEMIFSGYDAFAEFVSFTQFTPLKLCYKPRAEWAYLDCTVSKLDKSEIEYSDGRLHCNIDFTGTSKWYIPRTTQRTVEPATSSKKYDYAYSYTYSESINGIISLINNSSEESPSVITIIGPVTNPAWNLVVNGKVIQSGSITGTIADGNKLVINSKDNELEIAEYTTENVYVRNLYQLSDFSKDNFIIVPVGSSTLSVLGVTSGSINAWIEIEEIHETI